MNKDWEQAIKFVLDREGGYTLDPNDLGGETNFGISKRAYPNLDIKNLTIDQAKEIYKRDYWQACKCDELPSHLSIAVFDAAVNQGVGTSIRMLQSALDVVADGIIGDQTISAAFKSSLSTSRKFLAIRMSRYISIIVKNPTQQVFSVNWNYRVLYLYELILRNSK